MKAKLLVILALIPFVFYGQTVSPLNTDEYCPLTATNFTFTVAGIYDYASVSVVTGNPSISSQSFSYSSGNTLVSATIQFEDWNRTQTIRFSYTLNGNTYNTDFPFKKIRSLYIGDPLSAITPNISSITATPCTSQNFSISFSNVPYVNVSESPKITFGSISGYQYSLPAGWSLNGGTAVSGTTDYRTGTNTATITSDLSNGDNGVVAIRAINNCSSSLNYGPWVTIPISRPKPPLTFNITNPICTSASFQANSVPSWVTNVLWSVTPSVAFSISNQNINPTTISVPSGSTYGQIQFTISASGCSLSFNYNTHDILQTRDTLFGGTPSVISSLSLYTGSGSENGVCQFQENYIPCVTIGQSSYPTWSLVSYSGSPQPSWNGTDQDIYVYFYNSHQNSLVLQLDATNTCGTTSYQFGFVPVTCAMSIMSSKYNISPNPTTGIIRIIPKETASSGGTGKSAPELAISKVEVYDLGNTRRLSTSFDYVMSASVNLRSLPPGTYVVIITNRIGTESQQVILK